MKFSVIVTCHNYRDYVVEAIESALAQTLPPLEVVVVDDGSTDGSGELLVERYGSHPVVKVVRTPNRGQLAAFVAGFRASRGELIAFLDADDRFRPGYLERLGKVYAERPSVDQVFNNPEKFGQQKGTWRWEKGDEDWGMAALQVWMRMYFIGVPTSGISARRALCERVFDLPESFWPEWRTRADDCLVYGGPVLGAHRWYIGTPLVEYRVHQSNNWMGAETNAIKIYRHRQHLSRLIAWYADAAGISVRMLRWACIEFKTKPKRTFDEVLGYLWLQLHAQMPPALKLRAFGVIFKHYLLNLRK